MKGEDEARTARRLLFARMRLVHDELDRLQTDANDRSSSVASKASFLAVSSGVIITATTVQIWQVGWVLGALPLLLATLGLACAAIALRPGLRASLSAQRLADRFLDSTLSPIQIERSIINDKVASLTAREKDLRGRAQLTTVGFVLLLAAATALVVMFAIALASR